MSGKFRRGGADPDSETQFKRTEGKISTIFIMVEYNITVLLQYFTLIYL